MARSHAPRRTSDSPFAPSHRLGCGGRGTAGGEKPAGGWAEARVQRGGRGGRVGTQTSTWPSMEVRGRAAARRGRVCAHRAIGPCGRSLCEVVRCAFKVVAQNAHHALRRHLGLWHDGERVGLHLRWEKGQRGEGERREKKKGGGGGSEVGGAPRKGGVDDSCCARVGASRAASMSREPSRGRQRCRASAPSFPWPLCVRGGRCAARALPGGHQARDRVLNRARAGRRRATAACPCRRRRRAHRCAKAP